MLISSNILLGSILPEIDKVVDIGLLYNTIHMSLFRTLKLKSVVVLKINEYFQGLHQQMVKLAFIILLTTCVFA